MKCRYTELCRNSYIIGPFVFELWPCRLQTHEFVVFLYSCFLHVFCTAAQSWINFATVSHGNKPSLENFLSSPGRQFTYRRHVYTTTDPGAPAAMADCRTRWSHPTFRDLSAVVYFCCGKPFKKKRKKKRHIRCYPRAAAWVTADADSKAPMFFCSNRGWLNRCNVGWFDWKEQAFCITLKKGIFIFWTHSVIGWCE